MKILDNSGRSYTAKTIGGTIVISKEDIPENVQYIDIIDETFDAQMGSSGYYVIADVEHKGSYLCRFLQKPDTERIIKQDLMPIFGVKNQNKCFVEIARGMKSELYIVVGVKNGRYYIHPRFVLDGNRPYEDISIKYIELDKNAGYSEMAAAYREFQLVKGACVPLRERVKTSQELNYAVDCPEIRIRMGWKPAPPQVLEQTVENEPEMKAACTFDRVKDIVDELKNQGVDKAQLCLVGWNVSGHDGRYPQMFPVEEKLGGEDKLRKLIAYAQEKGYQIVCHTNSTDCYNIADIFSKDIVIKNKDGSLAVNNIGWSGGEMYHLCPVKAWEYAQNDLPKVAQLGFKGIHYIDVMTVVPLRKCYDENHNANTGQTLSYYNKIMRLSHKLFGGFSSEGAFDFAARYLDYALYVSWSDLDDDFFDQEIPLWQIVYHGIILSNPSTATVNYVVKKEKNRLKTLEYGGRPSFYFYSKFMTGGHSEWLGKEDLICDTDEQLRFSVSKIKEAYDEYKKIRHLQKEFIVSHRETSKNVFETAYANGEKITVDYNKMTVLY